MANTTISIRSSGDTGVTPSLGVLANGELALNFADGILYYKTASNTLGTITTTEPAGLNQELQFNDSGSFGSNAGLTFNKTTGILTISSGAVVDNINVVPTLASSFDHANAAFNTANTDVTNISLSSGTYGNASSIPAITVEANGRISAITTEPFTAASIGDVLALSIALG